MTAEKEQTTQAMLAAVLDALPDACYALDVDGNCVYANRAAETLFGRSHAALEGQRPWPNGSAAQQAHRQAQNEQRVVVIEFFAPTPGYPVELRIAPAGEWHVATARKLAGDDRQELWEREQTARVAAEQSAQRLARLQEVTAAFSRALSPQRVAEVVANAGTHLPNAIAASMFALHDDGATLEVLHSVGYPPEMVSPWRTFPLATPVPIADAIRRRQIIWLSSLAERNAQYPQFAAAYRYTEERTMVSVPMLAGERVVGGLGLEFSGSRPFNHEDSEYLQALAQQAAHALERTRLYQETQTALQTSDEALARLDLVLNTAPVGMALWDANLRYIHINQVLASLNDLPAHEHIGRTMPELFPPMAKLIQPMLERVLATGETVSNFELHSRRRNSQHEGDWLISFYPVRLNHGQIVGVGAVVLDITERKRDEASRLLISQTTAAFAEALAIADVLNVLSNQVADALGIGALLVVRLTEDGAWLQVEHIYNYPLALMKPYRRVPLEAQSPVAEAIRTGQRIWLETREEQLASFPVDLGEHAIAGTWAALPLIVNGQIIGAVGLTFSEYRHFDPVQRDFIHQIVQQFAQSYERARLHEAERNARALAENAVKLRDQFLSIAAHELKTPLTSLLGNTQLLERHLRRNGMLNEREQHWLGVVIAQSRRLNQMIMALLDIARIQGGQLSIERRETNLTQLVQRVAAEIQPTLMHHTLVYIAPPEAVVIHGDELRLEQVLQNLVQNAIKYSPRGGEVRIELEGSAPFARIHVRDQGMGIPPEALSHIFERFYRATNADPQRISGMGIGLFVVKEIVELHGGEVSVASSEGAGSTFTVALPLSEQ